MWFASGNRDEAKFDDPYRARRHALPERPHDLRQGRRTRCLGANLARLEIRIMFEELLPRLASIEQTGEIERVRSNFVNGDQAVPRPGQGASSAMTETETRLREFESDLVVESYDVRRRGRRRRHPGRPGGRRRSRRGPRARTSTSSSRPTSSGSTRCAARPPTPPHPDRRHPATRPTAGAAPRSSTSTSPGQHGPHPRAAQPLPPGRLAALRVHRRRHRDHPACCR